MAGVFWVQEKFCFAIASQLENLEGSAAQVAEQANFCDKPVVILSAMSTPPKRRAEHEIMARRLSRGRHVLAEKSTHWIMQDQPALVISAIHAVAQSFKDEPVASHRGSPAASGQIAC
jgi:pimeloyl-ACP methyl ester carboxylesterase